MNIGNQLEHSFLKSAAIISGFFFGFVFFFVCLFCFGHTVWQACGILVLWPGSKPMLPALEAWSLNHWITKEVS